MALVPGSSVSADGIYVLLEVFIGLKGKPDLGSFESVFGVLNLISTVMKRIPLCDDGHTLRS